MTDSRRVELGRAQIPYRRKLDYLVDGGCKGIFPLSIAEDEHGFCGTYRTDGYRRLSQLEQVPAAEVLVLLEKTLDAIEACRQYLIFPEEYQISTQTAYVNSRFSEVRFAYLPAQEEAALAVKLTAFIAELGQITTENGRLYLRMAGELISTEELSRKKIKALLLRLREEIKLCDII